MMPEAGDYGLNRGRQLLWRIWSEPKPAPKLRILLKDCTDIVRSSKRTDSCVRR
jgi:hypothetical protein